MPNDPIEHVIVLMMENRSFDHMLGCMKQVYPALEGIDTKNPLTNPESDPKLPAIPQQARPRDITNPDPKHETTNVLFQLDSPAPGKCQGFVQDYVNFYAGAGKPPFDHSETMCYFPLGSLGALHALAQSFTICDHWFSSLPGPTWPNRFFVTTGTSLGHVDMPQGIFHPALHNYNQDTIFNQLGNAGKTWKVYAGDFPSTLLLRRLWFHPSHFKSLDTFFRDVAGDPADFPEFSFLEPCYFNTFGNQNDQHPPTSVAKGDALIGKVYNAIRANTALWNQTLFVLLYDEHGGFADHVWTKPGGAVPPDGNTSAYSFDRYGLRVPAILISPWVEKGVDPTVYDHTSLLKYLANKWGVAELGARTESANSFGQLLTRRTSPRSDTPAAVPAAEPSAALIAEIEPPLEQLNDHQRALYHFTEYLETLMAPVEPAEDFRNRSIRAMASATDAGAVATERVQKFLGHLQEKRIDVGDQLIG
jgi:phospholipase C